MGDKYKLEYKGRAPGKTYEQLQNFISSVKKGEKPLLIGLDFVCMSRKVFDKLIEDSKVKE